MRTILRLLVILIVLLPLFVICLAFYTEYIVRNANKITYSFEYWDNKENRKYSSVTINGEDARSICERISNSEYTYIFSDTGIFDKRISITLYVNDWCHIKLLLSRTGTGTALRYTFFPLGYYCPKEYKKIENILNQYTNEYRVIGPG